MSHVNIVWKERKQHYRISRIAEDGTETMFVFQGCFIDALKSAEYFYSLGDVQ